MILPMVILAIASIIMGYIFKDLYIGLGSPFNSIFTHPNNLSIIDTEFSIPTYIKLLPLILTILSTITVLFIYEYLYKFFNPMIKLINIHSKKFPAGPGAALWAAPIPFITNIYIFMNNKFMLDQILNNIILRSMIYLGILFNQYIDKGLLYQLGPTGIYNTLNILSYKLISLSSNTIIPTAKSSNELTGNLYTTGIRHYTTYLITVLSFIILAYLINSSYILILFILLLLI
jgi:NADH-ubiquinone oxidoreductase chain 5